MYSPQAPWQRRYRDPLEFDEVRCGSHCVDCYPGNCSYNVYVRDGVIVREEIRGATERGPDSDVPDDLPLGCNKGAAWSRQLDAPDRVLWPLRRVGERGSGSWERISWDDALDQIADGLIDALEESGAETILREGTPEVGAATGADRFVTMLGGTVTDLNGSINDYAAGLQITFGKPNQMMRPRDLFHCDTMLIWHINPVYTLIPVYHYLTEARYRGANLVLISPDVSPSHTHVDVHVPVSWGSDPALALAMCQVIVEEDLVDADFIRTQTDLSLLVRVDTGRFLRASEVEEGARDDQFFHLDPDRGIVSADRGHLFCDYSPALVGSTDTTLLDGTTVEVRPLFVRVSEHLQQYTPENVQTTTSVHPDMVRKVARMAASGRTLVAIGGSASKIYHADLFQRATHLLLALTGNWGRKGSGTHWWNVTNADGMMVAASKAKAGPEGTEAVLSLMEAVEASLKEADPTLTDELASFEMFRTPGAGRQIVPPFFFWYWHCGYRDRWNNESWGDPTLRRKFDEYVEEAMASGWWDGLQRPGPDKPPRVLIECGGNIMRRTRGGRRVMLDHLWPKLDLIVTVDFRMSITAMHSDIVLPAAQHYEKVATHMPSLELVLGDRVVEPAGESRPEWEIFADLAHAMERRAAARGLTHLTTYDGQQHRYDELWKRFTLGGEILTTEQFVDESIRDGAYMGSLPPGSDLARLRETGRIGFTSWGRTPFGRGEAAPFPEDGKLFTSLSNHVDRGDPYPTLTRRAQFMIEHPWFVEAGEDLPVHKDPPPMGGPRPYMLSTGHNRWSIHAMNMANPVLLQTHRGEPHVVVNPADAEREGIADNGLVEITNDAGSFVVRAKLSPSQRPGGVTVYAGWDGFMFKDWAVPSDVEPGLVKHLGLAGGYGHLRYAPLEWQPVPCDRPVTVSIRPAD